MNGNGRNEVITCVARNLEPYRGFHVFMRALPEVLRRRPHAQVVIGGGDGVSYGAPAAPRSTFRDMLLQELGDRLDLSRVHFLGTIDSDAYLSLLQISAVHVYLTYPLVLSWSFVEAMACGCLIVGSSTPPVLEVLRATAVERFDLKRTVLQEWLALFDALAHGRRLGKKIAPPAPRRAAPSRGARRATG